MVDPGEAAASIVLWFFGIMILWAVYAALYGGDVTGVTNLISALAGPILFLAILVFFALALVNAATGQ